MVLCNTYFLIMMNKKLFLNKNFTSDGKPRAYVELRNIETLWFNTGTLCNLQVQRLLY